MNHVSVGLLRFILYIFYIFPLKALYLFAPVIKYILEFLARYRKQTIQFNLQNSLPSFTSIEISTLVSSYYSHLSEIIIENLKLFSSSRINPSLAFTILNPEILDDAFEEKRDVILLTGHLGNWELGFSVANDQLKQDVIGVYKQQSNEYFDKFLLQLRQKRGVVLISEDKFVKTLLTQAEKPRLFMLIPDQNPKVNKNIEIFTFLNQRTSFNTSIEKIALKYKIPVLYGDIAKLSRGVYCARLLWIINSFSQQTKIQITGQYAKLLERNIRSNPTLWLWSHRRWKN